jgi:molybdopterin molybdotransferase
MIPLDEAVRTILERTPVLAEERVPLHEAGGRFLARELLATVDSPRFDNSSVDGFAAIAASTAGARADRPCRLRVLGTVAAGTPWSGALAAGEALKIMTGAPLPAGADAVAMVEDAQVQGGDVVLTRPLAAGQNVRRQGEEYREGARLLPAGRHLTPPVVGLLASQGYPEVAVRRRPRVAVLTTGSEVVEPGARLQPGQIYDANRHGLLAALRALDLPPVLARQCPDDVALLRRALDEAFALADVVLTTGGVSMGDFDHVREVAVAAGLQPLFWKVAIKPGRPTFFGTFARGDGLPDGLLFGLAGNPVGALLSFELLVRPVLDRMQGATPEPRERLRARLAVSLDKAAGRLELVRGSLRWRDGELEVEPILARESHMLLGLARADCALHLPRDAEHVDAGALVEVEVLRWR